MPDVFSLRKEGAHKLAIKRTSNSKILGAELLLFLIRDFAVDVHRIPRDIVIIVAHMQLVKVVQVDFKDVIVHLIIPHIALYLFFRVA